MLAHKALTDELAVIVNKDNGNVVDKALLAEIYTGQSKLWRGGGQIQAYDLPDDDPSRLGFCETLLGKSIGNMRALAAQNLFSGKAIPPKKVGSDEEMKKAVSSNKGAIGYIKASATDDSIKVVAIR
jgi:ABC-type phosphate transport system substrate-binding protein